MRGQLFRNLMWVALLLVSLSETLILQWARIVVDISTLAWPGFLAALGVLAALNLLFLFGVRRYSREVRAAWLATRVYMVGSVGALASGPLLGIAFAGVGAWLLASDLMGGGPEPKRAFAYAASGGVAVALSFGSILYGFLVGQRRVVIEKVDVPMPHLPARLAGLRIAHITDLHIGPQLRAPQLARFVERVNAVGAELIVITGDIFDYDPQYIEEGCRELAKLHAPHGVFAVLGNHDLYTGAEAVAEGLASLTGIRLLRDESVALEIAGERLFLLGIDDPGRGLIDHGVRSPALARMAQELPQDEPRVLLVHRPSYLPQIAELGLPLALAGHTHGGQVTLPRRAEQLNIARLVTPWTRGLYRAGDSLLYVNRGLGVTGLPVRLNCPREIALVRLVRDTGLQLEAA